MASWALQSWTLACRASSIWMFSCRVQAKRVEHAILTLLQDRQECSLRFFLEQSRDNPQAVRNLNSGSFPTPGTTSTQNRRAGGWLVFSTHDISATPTPWGCTPGFFEDIVRCAVDSGARILPVAQAWEVLSTSS